LEENKGKVGRIEAKFRVPVSFCKNLNKKGVDAQLFYKK